jgi:hypothetical protein
MSSIPAGNSTVGGAGSTRAVFTGTNAYAEAEIRRYDAIWREAHSAALTVAQSMKFIKEAITSLED